MTSTISFYPFFLPPCFLSSFLSAYFQGGNLDKVTGGHGGLHAGGAGCALLAGVDDQNQDLHLGPVIGRRNLWSIIVNGQCASKTEIKQGYLGSNTVRPICLGAHLPAHKTAKHAAASAARANAVDRTSGFSHAGCQGPDLDGYRAIADSSVSATLWTWASAATGAKKNKKMMMMIINAHRNKVNQ